MHILRVYYKPDDYPYWVLWREFSQELKMIGKPSALGNGGIPTVRAGFLTRLSFGKPKDNTDDIVTKRNLRRGYEFQIRFSGTGHIVFNRFRLHAKTQVETSRAVNK